MSKKLEKEIEELKYMKLEDRLTQFHQVSYLIHSIKESLPPFIIEEPNVANAFIYDHLIEAANMAMYEYLRTLKSKGAIQHIPPAL